MARMMEVEEQKQIVRFAQDDNLALTMTGSILTTQHPLRQTPS
jgi:hypothetical protein